VLIVCTGDSVARAEQLAALLEAEAIPFQTLIVSRFDSATSAGVARVARQAKVIVAVEHHYRVGGLYSLVAETVADLGLPLSVVADGVHSLPIGTFGSREYMERQFMAPLDDIVNDVRRRLYAS
jgi:transketolase C-terminal domain/subunit